MKSMFTVAERSSPTVSNGSSPTHETKQTPNYEQLRATRFRASLKAWRDALLHTIDPEPLTWRDFTPEEVEWMQHQITPPENETSSDDGDQDSQVSVEHSEASSAEETKEEEVDPASASVADTDSTSESPSQLVDDILFRCTQTLQLQETLSIKPHRRTYRVRLIDDDILCVLVMAETHVPFTSPEVPHEVQVLWRLREAQVPGCTPLLVWAPLSEYAYSFLLPFYHQCEIPYMLGTNVVLVAQFMRQLLSTLEGYRAAGLIHGDVCLERLAYNPLSQKLHLLHFSQSPEGPESLQYTGQGPYDAPEKYTLRNLPDDEEVTSVIPQEHRSDVYSAGVVLASLVRGECTHWEPAVLHAWLNTLRRKNLGDYKLEVNLMLQLLVVNLEDRPTAAEALHHPLFTETFPEAEDEQKIMQAHITEAAQSAAQVMEQILQSNPCQAPQGSETINQKNDLVS